MPISGSKGCAVLDGEGCENGVAQHMTGRCSFDYHFFEELEMSGSGLEQNNAAQLKPLVDDPEISRSGIGGTARPRICANSKKRPNRGPAEAYDFRSAKKVL